jgi:hypothetical protein
MCPECGKPGRWRSGVGFEHEMICMKTKGHKSGNDCVWEPGAEIPGTEITEAAILAGIAGDDGDLCAAPEVIVRHKKHMTISLAKVVDAINQKYSPAVRIPEGAAVKLVGTTLEIEWNHENR